MNGLSEWLDSWRPIRSGFEQLSLANPSVALCCWPVDAPEWEYAYKRLESIQPEQFLMGLAEQEQIGSLHWWLLHEGLARTAQSSTYDHLPIGDELDRANRVCSDFKNHADHAGNLLAQAPKDRFSVAEGLNGRKLWIKALFDEAEQPPFRLRTQPYRPLWAEVLDWPFGIKTLVENPFAASVVLVDVIRDAAIHDLELLLPASVTDCHPCWNSDRGELSFRGQVVRRVSGQATNIRTVLDAFQESGWPARIDDPLPGGKNQARINETCRRLNEKLLLLRFFGDGSGQGFAWEVLAREK